jgi:cytochrome b561
MTSPQAPQKQVAQISKSRFRINSAFQHLWSIHWWMATCYLVLFVVGFGMVRMHEDTALQDNAYTLHKSFGALTMALLTWRIVTLQRVWWRKHTRRLPKISGEWVRTCLLHTTIYVFMLVVPISGFFLSNSYQSGNVPFFWVATVPDMFPKNAAVVELARDLHFWIAYTFLALIVLHMIDQQKYVKSFWRRANQTITRQFGRL